MRGVGAMAISTVYDQEADAVYVTLAGGASVRTVEFDPGTLVDVDAAGNPVGVEVLHPRREWPLAAIGERFDLDPRTLHALASVADGLRRPLRISHSFYALDMALTRR
ncbi:MULTISPECIES: DUF2283 domain-containing protein [Catenuloplanes]|uniref:Uncharacterized protein YuzE n=1 Tax=Catenuloplanes niger TaxID=587534 RepID=A0AAE3ZV64_9ACTN|nr:DUF2283 domain-containing protein [Catenuloplanes niger]MDR7324510.1 uncharacterized protein YuzE [Catenuloplanes niger]